MSSGEKGNIPDVKDRVMEEIKQKKVKMICPAVVLAKKIGMEGALAGLLLWGGFLVSAFLYFLGKTHLFRFTNLGVPGIKAFLAEIPYDYVALFFLSLILAIFLAGKMDLCYEGRISNRLIFPSLFLGSILVGMIFLGLGINEFIGERKDSKVSSKVLIWGRVLEMNPGEVVIEEEDGRIVRVEMKKYGNTEKTWPAARGKILRAVGERNEGDWEYFRAESVLCCDAD